MTLRELHRLLRSNGFELVPERGKGSHRFYQRKSDRRRVTVPYVKGQIPSGTLAGILRQIGLERPR